MKEGRCEGTNRRRGRVGIARRWGRERGSEETG